MNESKIPCKWCGTPTPMLGTKLCDRCWELEGRIGRDPDLAARMLAAAKPVVVVPLETARLVRKAFLPTNPNRMRQAHPDVLSAAKGFIAAVESQGVDQ